MKVQQSLLVHNNKNKERQREVPRPKDSFSYPAARATANPVSTTGLIRNTLHHGNDRAKIRLYARHVAFLQLLPRHTTSCAAISETQPNETPTDWTFRPDDHYY